MAPPLSSIFDAVNAQISTNLAAAGISPSFGTAAIDRNFEDTPPRIVWVPTDEDINPARGQGGDITVDAQQNMNINGTQPLYSRIVTVECDVWGDDRDVVDEFMINAVFSAVHDTCTHGSYGVQGARWLLPEEVLKKGECYRIKFQFFVPVARVTPQTTTATFASAPMTPVIGH